MASIFDNFRDPKNTQPDPSEYTDEDIFQGFLTGDDTMTYLYLEQIKKAAAEIEAKEAKK